MIEPESIHSTRWTNVRRSQRVLLSVPVEVYLQAENASLLSEEGHTLVVNAHGGLLKLAMKVQPGQTLVMKNRESGEQQECRVVHMQRAQADTNEVGILFARPAPRFWGVDFPPADWKPFLEQREEH
jgi:hypothetical protein